MNRIIGVRIANIIINSIGILSGIMPENRPVSNIPTFSSNFFKSSIVIVADMPVFPAFPSGHS